MSNLIDRASRPDKSLHNCNEAEKSQDSYLQEQCSMFAKKISQEIRNEIFGHVLTGLRLHMAGSEAATIPVTAFLTACRRMRDEAYAITNSAFYHHSLTEFALAFEMDDKVTVTLLGHRGRAGISFCFDMRSFGPKILSMSISKTMVCFFRASYRIICFYPGLKIPHVKVELLLDTPTVPIELSPLARALEMMPITESCDITVHLSGNVLPPDVASAKSLQQELQALSLKNPHEDEQVRNQWKYLRTLRRLSLAATPPDTTGLPVWFRKLPILFCDEETEERIGAELERVCPCLPHNPIQGSAIADLFDGLALFD